MLNNSLKTCVVVTSFDKNQPGFLDFSYRIASLAKEYQLTVLSLSTITQPELIFEQVDYKVLPVAGGKLGWASYIVKCALFIRRMQPDVVVLLHTAVAPISLLIGKVPSCLYWNEHPSNLMHLPEKTVSVRYYLVSKLHQFIFFSASKAQLIMPIGEEHRDDLYAKHVGLDKVNMLYMGVSDDFLLTANTLITETLRLVYIGTVSQARGRDVMLGAMAIVAKNQLKVHLTIVGASDAELVFCQAYIKESGMEHHVKVMGRVMGNQIPQFLASADVGICLWEPNPWNEFNPPTKLFEYLVAGIPVLASNIRTHTRYVHAGINGLIFDYDQAALANVITELATDKYHIQVLKQGARMSGEIYLWSKIEPKFLALIRNLVKQKVASHALVETEIVTK